jgi:hypothetical protein
MDPEIDQQLRERIAAPIFDEAVNELPAVPYLAVWEGGAGEIAHAYMSPKIETLCGYSPRELAERGYINIVGDDIISFFRDEDTYAWVIDRSVITRFRNACRGNVICLSSGILLESTELLEKRGHRTTPPGNPI